MIRQVLLSAPNCGPSEALYIMKRRLMTVAVAMITASGAPPARSCTRTICADPAKINQPIEKACHAVMPAATWAAPQTMPSGKMAMVSGAKARSPATNSLRAFGT